MSRPGKPYPEFPLTAHPNGQWCKKIRGRIHYFGALADWESALNLYQQQRDDLYAGRKPRHAGDGVTMGLAMDKFLSSKKLAEQAGEISSRSYGDYERTCDRIADSLGKNRLITDIDVTDLDKLRSDLSNGKRGKRGPSTMRGDLTRARMVFLYVNEYVAEKPILYRKALRSPGARVFRMLANDRGPRMFERDQIKTIIKSAPVQLTAMIYLGINCGFGNADCGSLPLNKLDLEKGWHSYWRPKTHNPRRCPLWPETVKTLRNAIEERPKAASEDWTGLVFLTRYGNPWSNAQEERDNPISYEFRKLLVNLGIYKKNVTTFYSLRRTFETIGSTAGDQVAVDHIMGHIAPTDDMAAVYRQKTFDAPLLKVTNHVRAWLNGRKRIV